MHTRKSKKHTKHHSCILPRPTRYFLHLGSISAALTDSADMGLSLYASNVSSNIPLVVFAGMTSFIISIGLNDQSSAENYNEICDILEQRNLPYYWEESERKEELIEDWPLLSSKKELASRLIVMAPIAIATVTDGIKTFFFLNAIPDAYPFFQRIPLLAWRIFSLTTGASSGLSTLLTEGTETYKCIRKLMHGDIELCSLGSIFLGAGTTVLDSINDASVAYIAIKTITGINNIPLRGVIGFISLFNGFTHFCNTGSGNISFIDGFFQHIRQRNFSAKNMAIFSISLTLSVFFAYYNRALNEIFYNELASDFYDDESDVIEKMALIFSWIMFIHNSYQGAGYLYQPLTKIIDKIKNKVRHFFCDDKTEADEVKQVLLPEDNSPIEIVIHQPIVDVKDYQNHIKNNPHLIFNKHKERNKEPSIQPASNSYCVII